jgi:hypothetical protein
VELESQLLNTRPELKRLVKRSRAGNQVVDEYVPPPRQHVQRPVSVAERLGPATVARLVSDYQGGMSIKDVATKYGCAKASVLKILAAEGVATRPTGVNTLWLEEKHYRRAARKRGL